MNIYAEMASVPLRGDVKTEVVATVCDRLQMVVD